AFCGRYAGSSGCRRFQTQGSMSAIAPAQVAQKAERETGAMAKYLISFPSAAMVVPEGEWEDVVRDSHAVIEEAKAAGVYVFGGGIDEGVPPVLVSATAR